MKLVFLFLGITDLHVSQWWPLDVTTIRLLLRLFSAPPLSHFLLYQDDVSVDFFFDAFIYRKEDHNLLFQCLKAHRHLNRLLQQLLCNGNYLESNLWPIQSIADSEVDFLWQKIPWFLSWIRTRALEIGLEKTKNGIVICYHSLKDWYF